MSDVPAIGLIALDLDGTLVKGPNGVTPPLRASIRNAQDAGIQITIATGRMYRSARRFAEDLGVKESRIAYGVPMGGELEYVDSNTLIQAINNRNLIGN